MNPDLIPTSITQLTYSAPGPTLSQNESATLLAHYWPAIEAHVRAQAADDILASPGHPADSAPAWDSSRDRDHAARIARGAGASPTIHPGG
ncbi:hypothetical protein [Streptomyces sp. B29(2018)]|uniref:hypothetical protein n=1 Tax=Streptomyces sp. B29(2018) TaxID=2485016 RepID=UPI000FD69F21|nr:hypothetical protein [Streptomyces sp. B29(2018)]